MPPPAFFTVTHLGSCWPLGRFPTHHRAADGTEVPVGGTFPRPRYRKFRKGLGPKKKNNVWISDICTRESSMVTWTTKWPKAEYSFQRTLVTAAVSNRRTAQEATSSFWVRAGDKPSAQVCCRCPAGPLRTSRLQPESPPGLPACRFGARYPQNLLSAEGPGADTEY